MDKEKLESLMNDSIFTAHNTRIIINGKFLEGTTYNSKKNFILGIANWQESYQKIIKLIIEYTENKHLDSKVLNEKINTVLSDLEEIHNESNDEFQTVKKGSYRLRLRKKHILPAGTRLYRYTDDSIHHAYANPYPDYYGRFTEPRKNGVFYLSLSPKVAKEEVKNSNSHSLVVFELTRNLELFSLPGTVPVITNSDSFFEKRLRRFHNLLITLTTKNREFRNISDKVRLTDAIYITTNTLLHYLITDELNAVIYPSTKVRLNQTLGYTYDNTFHPNKDNANIAIFNDINFDEKGTQFSKYLKIVSTN